MKSTIEILIILVVWIVVIHSVLYLAFFDNFCNKYSWIDETDQLAAIAKLATCKDSIICEPTNIVSNNRNEVTGWSCLKKDSGFIHINLFNHLKNSITQ